MEINRSLLLRANRSLGNALVENKLATTEQIDRANEKLLEVIQGGNLKQGNLINILVWELKSIKESDILDFLVESEGTGLVDLSQYNLKKSVPRPLALGDCWATLSLPFDQVEGFTFMSSACYLSDVVRDYWTRKINQPVIWYATSIGSLTQALERIESFQEEEREKPEVERVGE